MNHETHEKHKIIIFKEECYKIQGAVFEVCREMRLTYKGEQLRQIYKPDLICYNQIIIELKAVKEVAAEHKAQVINYLKATGLKLGLLINFGSYPKASITRLVL